MALAVAGTLLVAVSAGVAAEKKSKPAAKDKATEQTMPGCSMHGAGMEGPEKAMEPGMPGCGMKGGQMGRPGMKCGPGGMAGCGMHGGGMKCGPGGMAGCDMHGGGKGGPGMRCGPGMRGGMGSGKCGPGMRGGMGPQMCGPGMGRGKGCGPGMAMLHALDLTADQQKKVKGIHERQARLAVQAQADMRIAAMDMRALMSDEKPDKARVDAQIDKIARLRAEMQKSRAATLLEVRSLLTPEQLKKWQAGPMESEDPEDEGEEN
jgi:Spy/CpxP family protein refolding chaperone